MNGGDNFCLRLNEFEANIKRSWQEMQIEQAFCDVTLACDDKQIRTHKFVISSCSPVLRNILMANQAQHPLIYLRQVKFRNLQNLLSFMYQGEVNIAEEDLSNFLEIAKDLNIKGLSERNMNGLHSNEEEFSQDPYQDIDTSSKRTLENKKVKNSNDNNFVRKVSDNVINTDANTMLTTTDIKIEKMNKVLSENKKKNIISTLDDSKLVEDPGLNSCDKCEYRTKNLSHLKQHVKSIHEGERYPCNQCKYISTDKSTLRRHIKSIHEGKRYECDQCDYRATQTSSLRIHQLKLHA